MKEIFDIINFINKYYNKFIITKDDQVDEQINKSIMFLIYISIVFIFLSSNMSALSISILIVLIIIKINYTKEKFNIEKKCRKPTNDNPFMNVLMKDDGLEACDVSEKEILDKYNNNLYRNINDVFDKNNGQLYFRTNNVTTLPTLPNKYAEFLNFIKLENKEPDDNCKYDGVNCEKYNDIKLH